MSDMQGTLSGVGTAIGSAWGPIGGAVGGAIGSFVGGIFGGSSKRKKAKAQARARKEQLKLQYAFDVSDQQRQMIYNQESKAFQDLQNSLKLQDNINNAMFNFSTANLGGSTINNGIDRALRSEKLAQDLYAELEFDKQQVEFERMRIQGKINLRRGMASADAGVPTSGDIFTSSFLSGLSTGVSSYVNSGGTFGFGDD